VHPISITSCKLAPRAMKPDLDRTYAHAQQVCDLRCREPVRLIQQDHGAVAVRQVVQAPLHAGTGFRPLDPLVRGRVFHGGRLPAIRLFLARQRDLLPASPQTIHTDVGSDAIQPAARRVEIAKRFLLAVRA
jgi:hypothetical protein